MNIDNVILKVVSMDWNKWSKNVALFLAPAILLFLLSIESGHTLEESYLVLKLWVLNSSIDLVRKFIAANPNEK